MTSSSASTPHVYHPPLAPECVTFSLEDLPLSLNQKTRVSSLKVYTNGQLLEYPDSSGSSDSYYGHLIYCPFNVLASTPTEEARQAVKDIRKSICYSCPVAGSNNSSSLKLRLEAVKGLYGALREVSGLPLDMGEVDGLGRVISWLEVNHSTCA